MKCWKYLCNWRSEIHCFRKLTKKCLVEKRKKEDKLNHKIVQEGVSFLRCKNTKTNKQTNKQTSKIQLTLIRSYLNRISLINDAKNTSKNSRNGFTSSVWFTKLTFSAHKQNDVFMCFINLRQARHLITYQRRSHQHLLSLRCKTSFSRFKNLWLIFNILFLTTFFFVHQA